MVMWFAWVIWEEFYSDENTPEGHTETHKSWLFPFKQVSRRKCDHEWLRMTNAFILYDLLWKIQKSQAANRECSFIFNVKTTKLQWPKYSGIASNPWIVCNSLHYVELILSYVLQNYVLGFTFTSVNISNLE